MSAKSSISPSSRVRFVCLSWEFESGDFLIEQVEISAAVGEQFLERRHLFGVEFERDDVAVVDVFVEPGFQAVAAPAAAEFAELIAQFGEDRRFFSRMTGAGWPDA